MDMRAAGKQYKEISAELGIEVSALKVFVHRQKHKDVRRCEQCRKTLPKDARKTQRFCSDKCRNDWWYSHKGELQGERLTAFVCAVCGKEFTSYLALIIVDGKGKRFNFEKPEARYTVRKTVRDAHTVFQ